MRNFKQFFSWILVTSLLGSFLSSCSINPVQPTVGFQAATATATQQVDASTPMPTRPIYEPGTLVDYSAQTGDSLPAIAAHFNTTVREILEANPLIQKDITTLQAGFQLKVPIYYEALWGSQFQIIPDPLFVNGPAQVGFDTPSFVDSYPGWLKNYSVLAGEKIRRGGALVDYVATNYSISPRLLLAVAEYQSGALTNPVLSEDQVDYPLGYKDYYHKGFYMQLVWAANLLNDGYYRWRSGTIATIIRADGSMEVPDPWQNAASVALQNYYAYHFGGDAYFDAISQDGIYQTYSDLFGDPWQNVQPHIPGNLKQADLAFPFPDGKTWALTGGPHSAWGTEQPYAALDFAPGVSGCASTSEFATAMADGQVVRTEPAMAILDLDGDGDERTGWDILYLHLGLTDMVRQGTLVVTGSPMGHPSCEGGSATGTHIHIARKYNGEWIMADGAVPFDLQGWIAHNGSAAYLGSLTRYGKTVIADEQAGEESAITAGAANKK